MERIAGIVRFGGGDVVPRATAELGAALRRHGEGSLAIARSAEAAFLRYSTLSPNHDSPRGVARLGPCRIVADLRIDNRSEIAAALCIAPLAPDQDAELVLRAYLHWGESACEQLLGDFAYAIFDERTRRLHLARDETAARIVYYCDSIPDTLVFGSSASVVFACSLVPGDIDRARIADFLAGLEAHSVNSFFAHIKRLAPGFRLTRDVAGPSCIEPFECKASMPHPGALPPQEQLVEILSQAIRDRLLDGGKVGTMLSGGLDSSTIAALAADAQTDPHAPFPAFSAVDAGSESCLETRAIRQMEATRRFDLQSTDCGSAAVLTPRVSDTLHAMEDPFDERSRLIHVVYDLAADNGCAALFDGINADAMFGRRLPPFFSRLGFRRRVSWALHPRVREPLRRIRDLFRPRPSAEALQAALLAASLVESGLNRSFAQQVDLAGRLRGLSAELQRAGPVHRHPHTIAGIERYGRVASSFGCNALHPFNDLRVVSLLQQLPARLTGRPAKGFLRQAMASRLPEPVRLRSDKSHLGIVFRRTLRSARDGDSPVGIDPDSLSGVLVYLEPEHLVDLRKAPAVAGLTVPLAAWEARCESLNTLNVWLQRVHAASRSRSFAPLVYDQELDHGTVT